MSSDTPGAGEAAGLPFRLVGAVPAGGPEFHLGKPKGLFDAGEGTFLERSVAGLRTLGADPIVVGVDEPRGPLTSRVAAAGARSIQVEADAGTSFLSLALESVAESSGLPEEGVLPDPEGVATPRRPTVLLWLPVDLPLVRTNTLRQMVATVGDVLSREDVPESQGRRGGDPCLPDLLVCPIQGNRRGEVMAILLGDLAPPPSYDPWTLPVEEWLTDGVRLLEVDVDDPGIHKRIRTMADYRRHFPRVFRRRFQKW